MWHITRHGVAWCMRSAEAQNRGALAPAALLVSPQQLQWYGLQPYSSGTSDSALRNAEKLMDLMGSSPALQQMMLASLPPQLRGNPDMIKTMLADPGVKQKIVEMIAKQGIKLPDQALDKMSPTAMEDTFNRLKRVGINPVEMPQKLMAYPGIFKQLQEPRFMQAFLETAENPAAAVKYSGDVMEVVRKAQELLRSPPPPADNTPGVQDATVLSYSPSSPSSTPASSSLPSSSPQPQAPAAPGPSPAAGPTARTPPPPADAPSPPHVPFMHLLSQDPELAAKLQNPRVQKALEEISKSPWKTIKYVFDKDVMTVFKALDGLLKTGGKPKA